MHSAADLAALHALCFETPRPWSETEFSSLMDESHTFSVIQPLGFAMGRVIVDEAELLTLAVHPDARRQGTGKFLLQKFESKAKLSGAITSFLEVATNNHPAIRLYEGHGYRHSGRRRGYYHHPDGMHFDALILSRDLM